MADVFISYARESHAVAQRLAERLRAEGYDAWWDDQIPAHRPYAEVIEERLRAAGCVIVLWSEGAVRSQWVRAEADVARRDGKLIQAVLDAAIPPLPFDQLQRADLQDWTGEPDHPGWRKVEASVRQLLNAATGPRHADEITSPELAARLKPAARRPVRKHLVIVTVAALVLAAGVAVGLAWWPRPPPADLRVAVLPFDSPPGDREADALAAGLADTVIGDLADRQAATVAKDAARQPNHGNAKLLASGAVDRAGGDLRVRVRVDDAKAGVTLWSATIQRPASERRELQEEVADRLADNVDRARRAFEAEGARFDDPTLASYLHMMDVLRNGNSYGEGLLQVERDLVRRAPRFSRAHSNLAVDLAYSAAKLPPALAAPMRADAETEARLALKLDPHNGEGYQALYFLEPLRNWSQAEAALLQGLAVDPQNPNLIIYEGVLLRSVGRVAAGVPLMRQALSMDPRSPPKAAGNIDALSGSGQLADADDLARKSLRLWPDNPPVRSAALVSALLYAAPDAASRGLDDYQPGTPRLDPADEQAWRGYLRDRRAGKLRLATARALVAQARLTWRDAGAAVVALAQVGDVDSALALANAIAAADPSQGRIGYLFHKAAAPMHRDPRFMALADRLGMVAYWRKGGHWPDFCADPALRYDCRAWRPAAAPKP